MHDDRLRLLHDDRLLLHDRLLHDRLLNDRLRHDGLFDDPFRGRQNLNVFPFSGDFAKNSPFQSPFAAVVYLPRWQQPYTQNWFFGYQRSLPGKIVVEADYMGSKGTHLVQISNVNQFTGDLLNGGIFHGFNPSFSA